MSSFQWTSEKPAVVARCIWPTGPITARNRSCLANLEPGSLLVEDWKLKMDSNTTVCFDIPGGSKDRRREAADLGPDVPMLCSDAAPADKDADAVADTADS